MNQVLERYALALEAQEEDLPDMGHTQRFPEWRRWACTYKMRLLFEDLCDKHIITDIYRQATKELKAWFRALQAAASLYFADHILTEHLAYSLRPLLLAGELPSEWSGPPQPDKRSGMEHAPPYDLDLDRVLFKAYKNIADWRTRPQFTRLQQLYGAFAKIALCSLDHLVTDGMLQVVHQHVEQFFGHKATNALETLALCEEEIVQVLLNEACFHALERHPLSAEVIWTWLERKVDRKIEQAAEGARLRIKKEGKEPVTRRGIRRRAHSRDVSPIRV